MLKIVCGAMLAVTGLLAVVVVMSILFATPQSASETDIAQDADQPKPIAVSDARDAFRDDLHKDALPDAPLPDFTDIEAVDAAKLSDALRATTNAIPDTQARDANEVLELAAALPYNQQLNTPKLSYFELWDDLMARCYSTVADQKPFDETGLTPKGDDRIDYTNPRSQQSWFSADKAFTIKISLRKGYDGVEILRTCFLETNRFARVSVASIQRLKPQFHEWWTRERRSDATDDLDYPFDLDKRHNWYGGQTRFGSAQGCEMKLEFSEISFTNEANARFFLTETDTQGCTARPETGADGKVRTNRLPQIGN